MLRTQRLWMMLAVVVAFWGAREARAWCNPVDLQCGSVVTTNLSSGQTHDDIEQYNCTDTTRWKGNAHVYRVIAPANSDSLWITLEWAAGADWRYDLGLFVLASCNQNRCIDFDPHYIAFNDTTGQDYWIIVDGRRNQADGQSYTLSVFCGDDPLAVELTSFDAMANENSVNLSWSVASETNNSHFELSRSAGEEEPWLAIARVEGRGTSTSAADYSFVDTQVQSGHSYTYRLTSVDIDGSRHELGVTTATVGTNQALVGEFRLLGNYPNPFNPTTRIRFEIAEAGDYALEVFSVTGARIASLWSGNLESGYHEVDFSGNEFGSGVYFARLSGAAGSQMMKMILMK